MKFKRKKWVTVSYVKAEKLQKNHYDHVIFLHHDLCFEDDAQKMVFMVKGYLAW